MGARNQDQAPAKLGRDIFRVWHAAIILTISSESAGGARKSMVYVRYKTQEAIFSPDESTTGRDKALFDFL